jgi:branched-chain amino acid transport system substrate-binding protein
MSREEIMFKLRSSFWAILATCLVATVAHAEPLKIAVIEAFSGPLEATGRPFAQSAHFAVDELNEKAGYNGGAISIKDYDNQSTTAGASDQFRAAIADGIRIIFQAASSAIAAQLSDEVKRYNIRNPGKEVIFYNLGSEAGDLTGERCHFWFFRSGTNPDIRWKAMIPVLKSEGVLKDKAFLINQNYSYGLSVQKAQRAILKGMDIQIVGDVLHDLNKIQDFTPYVQQVKSAGADALLTGDGFNDMTLLLRAIRDSGLKIPLASITLDAPGTMAAAQDAALGAYNASAFSLDAGGDRMKAWADNFRKKVGRDPISYDALSYNAVGLLGEALKQSDFKGGPIDATKVALAIENATFDGPLGKQSMRMDDHQVILPIIISKVSKSAKSKVDGTDMGFDVIKAVSGPDAAVPPDPACKMQRP